MKTEIMQDILNTIKEYDRIVLFRHSRPDGDAVGSTLGMKELIRINFPEKDVRVINDDHSEYVKFLGEEDGPVEDGFYSEALGIAIDTAITDRISNGKYSLCKKLIKIDHHIPVEEYGDISWVEEERSSASEMIAAFYDAFKDELAINGDAARYIYAGMVTDSGRFRFSSVSGDTMRLAGLLLDVGIDTDTVFANLYMKEFKKLKFDSCVYKKMKITENGVAYVYVDQAMQKKLGLSYEDAGSCISCMDSIKNSLIWIAFIQNGKEIRVRLRSRFVTINELAEKYRGGGHACASGATVYNKKELKNLVRDADALLKDYKANHSGWL